MHYRCFELANVDGNQRTGDKNCTFDSRCICNWCQTYTLDASLCIDQRELLDNFFPMDSGWNSLYGFVIDYDRHRIDRSSNANHWNDRYCLGCSVD
mmetsp:Transcript_47286/g.78471  ORF Transcript_47286/g.78471 Transcript_47286/m.78471 type:complete len:96 (+) Transcript_47286:681-968(+)